MLCVLRCYQAAYFTASGVTASSALPNSYTVVAFYFLIRIDEKVAVHERNLIVPDN
jgi:hypothetical protein